MKSSHRSILSMPDSTVRGFGIPDDRFNGASLDRKHRKTRLASLASVERTYAPSREPQLRALRVVLGLPSRASNSLFA